VPPKTRWKEEQKEKARKMESAGKENLAVKVPEGAGDIVATVPEEEEARQALEGTRAETMATPEANQEEPWEARKRQKGQKPQRR